MIPSDWWPLVSAWVPALVSTTMLGIVGAIAGPIYRARIEKSVQHRFDAKLEVLRSQLRQDEEAQKAEVRRRDEQIAALRSGVLSGISSRHAALDKRRLEAVERLWSSMCELSTLKALSQLTSVMRMDRVLEIASAGGAESEKMKSFLESIWQSYKLDEVKNKGYPIAERPFVSSLLWTYFTAYRHILYYPYTLVALGRTGIGADALENKDKTLSIIASVLPHQKDNLDKFGTDLLHHLIDEIDQLILQEIERTLTGEDNDKRGMERAAAVITSAAAAFGAASPKFDISMIPDSIAKRDHPSSSPLNN